MKPWQNSEGYSDPTAYGAIKAENAREAELDFVGFEIEPEYFRRQEEAFQEFAAQQILFVNE